MSNVHACNHMSTTTIVVLTITVVIVTLMIMIVTLSLLSPSPIGHNYTQLKYTHTHKNYIVESIIILLIVLGLDSRNTNNCNRYSTFSDNRYRDQVSICTYAHVHSVQAICFFFLKTS